MLVVGYHLADRETVRIEAYVIDANGAIIPAPEYWRAKAGESTEVAVVVQNYVRIFDPVNTSSGVFRPTGNGLRRIRTDPYPDLLPFVDLGGLVADPNPMVDMAVVSEPYPFEVTLLGPNGGVLELPLTQGVLQALTCNAVRGASSTSYLVAAQMSFPEHMILYHVSGSEGKLRLEGAAAFTARLKEAGEGMGLGVLLPQGGMTPDVEQHADTAMRTRLGLGLLRGPDAGRPLPTLPAMPRSRPPSPMDEESDAGESGGEGTDGGDSEAGEGHWRSSASEDGEVSESDSEAGEGEGGSVSGGDDGSDVDESDNEAGGGDAGEDDDDLAPEE